MVKIGMKQMCPIMIQILHHYNGMICKSMYPIVLKNAIRPCPNEISEGLDKATRCNMYGLSTMSLVDIQYLPLYFFT